MIKDLRESAQKHRSEQTDVVIVGGGIAGLILATSLAKSGVRSLVLESGTKTSELNVDPLNEVVQVGQLYRGAESGRIRGLGGTSLRWGGAMIPFLPCDMGEHTARWPIQWPLTIEQLEPKFAKLERLFRLPPGPYGVESDGSSEAAEPSFILRSAKFPTFHRRNVTNALGEDLNCENLDIWLNATVTDFQLNANGHLAGVSATGPSGAKLSVLPKIVVVAAGAIESTRLLLLLDAKNNNRIFEPDGQLGHYFYDHLCAPAAIICPTDKVRLNETFGMRFANSGMRDLRIEPSRELRTRLGLPGAFARVTALSNGDNAFGALRAIYLAMQSRSTFQPHHFTQLARDLGWLVHATHWRLVKRRLLAPRNSSFELTLVIEQFPEVRNTISLATDRRDRYDTPLARIEWLVTPRDYETFDAVQSALTAYWERSRFRTLGTLQPTCTQVSHERLQRDSDHFHPGGTTRMGRDVTSGVVDSDLKTHRIDNLFVVSTSTFPSGGGSNPTFMLMAFALRAAEHIANRLKGGNTIRA